MLELDCGDADRTAALGTKTAVGSADAVLALSRITKLETFRPVRVQRIET